MFGLFSKPKVAKGKMIEMARFGTVDQMRELIEEGGNIDETDRNGDTPLIVATDALNPDIALLLIRRGADVHAEDIEGRQAIHYAAKYGFSEVVEKLLKKGVNVNAPGTGGSPLMEAVAGIGDVKTVKMLIDAGAKINCGTKRGGNLLHVAAEAGNAKVARVLLDAGVSPLEYDMDSKRPSMLAEDPITGVIIANEEHRLTEMGARGSKRF